MNNIKSKSAEIINHDIIYNYIIMVVGIRPCRHYVKFKKTL